jgi:hypothetical protein
MGRGKMSIRGRLPPRIRFVRLDEEEKEIFDEVELIRLKEAPM